MTTPSFIFDAHLDLAMNAIEWNRDYTRPLAEIRAAEARLKDKPDRGHGTVCFPEMRRAGIGLCVATQIARVEHDAWSPVSGWKSPAQAWAMTQAQLAWYRAMEEAGELVALCDRAGLERHLDRLTPNGVSPGEPGHALPGTVRQSSAFALPDGVPIGYILSLEGADSLVTLDHLERAWAYGLRAVGPAHYGPGLYANGTDGTGGLNARGRELLREMARLGFILDLTHLCDDAFWEALDLFPGPVWASHQNCRALVPHNRQWSDAMIRAAAQRGAVLGTVFDAWMTVPGWQRGVTTPESVGLRVENLVAHIDHICQLAGNACHVGIGSDLDGGFGTEQTPVDLQSIGDVWRVGAALEARGYRPADLAAIAQGNFIRCLRGAWAV
jgi:membrane dipeptidase